jgi:subtilisin family serine protease
MGWNHDFVRLGEALAALRQKQGGAEIDWQDTRVAHLDTGFTRHPAFDFTGDDSPFILWREGRNLLSPGQPPFDDGTGVGPLQHPGHGTRTMSALCGVAAGNFTGGCAPRLPIVPYRVVDDVVLDAIVRTDRSWEYLTEALLHAVGEAQCQIVSISLGGMRPTRAFGRAVDRAYESGVIVVAAAGQRIDRVTFPGFYARVIGVGGIRQRNGRFSIYNEYVDLADRVDVWAPADPIERGDMPTANAPAPVGTGDGTSYSTLHVVAAAAIWRLYRRADLASYPGWRLNEAFWHALNRSQSWTNMPVGANRYRNGVLDARALLDEALPDPALVNPNPRLAENEWG